MDEPKKPGINRNLSNPNELFEEVDDPGVYLVYLGADLAEVLHGVPIGSWFGRSRGAGTPTRRRVGQGP